MLQSGSCNGCGECPDALVERLTDGGFIQYVRRVYALLQGPSRDNCEARDTREIELRAFYSKHPFGNLDHEYFGDYRDGALAPTVTEPAVWATMISSARALYSEIEHPYWLDDDDRLRCKAKYIYTAYAYGQSSADHVIIGGDGRKLLPVLAWLMPDPDDEQKCIWQAIAMCGVCGEANVYNDSEVVIATEIFPPQPPFVCGLENTTQRWEDVEVTIYRTDAVAWTGKISVNRSCDGGVPELNMLFEQGNPCACTPPTPQPDCCNPQLYLTWKKTGGIECCGTDSAGLPRACQDFVEPVPDTNTLFTQLVGTKNLEEVFITGQPETRQWVGVWQLEHAGNGIGNGMACNGGCSNNYCHYVLFVMIQCCTTGYYYKWEWINIGRRLGAGGLEASGLWYNYFLPLWGPLGCIGDPITMDGTNCSCDFPNLPITTVGPFPGCDCQIEFEVRQHPLSTCDAVEIDCCTTPIPETLTGEVIASDFAVSPVGTTFDMVWDPTYEQWVGIVPGSDTFKVYLKCCGPTHGDFFGGWTNASGDSDGMNIAETMVECVGSSLIWTVTCDPFEAEANPWFVTNFDGTTDGTIQFRITE